jgi:hypothetical protein
VELWFYRRIRFKYLQCLCGGAIECSLTVALECSWRFEVNTFAWNWKIWASSWLFGGGFIIYSSKGCITAGLSLLNKIRRLLDLNSEIWVCHFYREVDICSDASANMKSDRDHVLMLYDHCPTQISIVLLFYMHKLLMF